MHLALSDADAQFETSFANSSTQVPADIRDRARQEKLNYPTMSSRRSGSSTRRGWRYPIGPSSGAGGIGHRCASRSGRTSCSSPAFPNHFRSSARQHGGPGDRALPVPRRSRNASYRPPPTSTSGGARLFGAGSRLRSGVASHDRRPRRRQLHHQRPEDLDHPRPVCGLDLRPGPHRSECPGSDRPVSHSSSLKWPRRGSRCDPSS